MQTRSSIKYLLNIFHEHIRFFGIQYFSNIFHVTIYRQTLKMHYFHVWSLLEQGCHKAVAWRTTTVGEQIVFGNEVSIELQVPLDPTYVHARRSVDIFDETLLHLHRA